MFVDLPGALCAHCQVSFTESVVPRCANHRSSVQTTPHAEADRVYLGAFAATHQRSVVYLVADFGVPGLIFLVLREAVLFPALRLQCGVFAFK